MTIEPEKETLDESMEEIENAEPIETEATDVSAEADVVIHDPTNISRLAYIGFTIFDFIHLGSCGFLLYEAFRVRPINDLLASESIAEIVFAFLLIGFIAILAKNKANTRQTFHGIYSFAWLTAIASILVPATMRIPAIIQQDWSAPGAFFKLFDIVPIVLSLTLFVLFMLSLIGWKNTRGWNWVMPICMVLVLLLAGFQFFTVFINGIEDLPEVIAECTKAIAPIPAAIIGLVLSDNLDFRS